MKKREMFINAMKEGRYKDRYWIISIFSITKPSDVVMNITTPYEIKSDQLGYYYYDPNSNKYEKIEDGIVSEPLFKPNEKVMIIKSDITNSNQDITNTTYGLLLFNYLCLVYPFNNKIPYINKEVNLKPIENYIANNLVNDIDFKKETDITVSEYLKYSESTYYLTGLSQLFAQGITEKVLLPAPGINEKKKELLLKYKDTINTMSTIAKIDSELIKYDSEYLKGDPGEKFLISGKSRDVVRKKLFMMLGAEEGLDGNNVNAKLITNSLTEGWDPTKVTDMNNSLRAGSYNRGAQTQLGGVTVKELLRSSNTINVTIDDCGSNLGSYLDVTEDNKHKLLGFKIIDGKNTSAISSDSEACAYIGKKIMVRNPMYCKLPNTDYCKTCIGTRLSINPTGISVAVANVGSVMLGIFMSAMHGKSIKLAKLDIKKCFI